MKRLRIALIQFLCIFSWGCSSKIVVVHVPQETTPKKAMDGVFYALPKTVVKVDVPVERTASTRGRYKDYLPLFFPRVFEAGSFVEKEGVALNIAKATFDSFGEPDVENVYYVKLTGHGPVDRTALLEYTDQGALTGAEVQVDNNTVDIALSVLSAASGLTTRLAFGGAAASGHETADCIESEQTAYPTLCQFLKGKSTLLFNFRHPAVTAEVKANMEAAVTKNGMPSLKDANSIYEQINTLNNRRSALLDKPGVSSLDAQLKELDLMISTEMDYWFKGRQTKDTWTGSFEVRPTAVTDRIELFKIKPDQGICVSADLRGKEKPAQKFLLKGQGGKPLACSDVTDAKAVTVQFALDREDQMFRRVSNNFTDDRGERSFRYRIPANTKITLHNGDLTVTEIRMPVGQFGRLISLPASNGGKSLNYNLKFYAATGALQSFKLTSKAVLQKAVVDTASTSANSILDAKTKEEGEVNQLDRQLKILDDKKKIQGLCKDLNLSCGGNTVSQPASSQP